MYAYLYISYVATKVHTDLPFRVLAMQAPTVGGFPIPRSPKKLRYSKQSIPFGHWISPKWWFQTLFVSPLFPHIFSISERAFKISHKSFWTFQLVSKKKTHPPKAYIISGDSFKKITAPHQFDPLLIMTPDCQACFYVNLYWFSCWRLSGNKAQCHRPPRREKVTQWQATNQLLGNSPTR